MFQYDAALLAAFPNTVGGVIRARGMSNCPSPDTLQDAFISEQKRVIEAIGETALSDLSSLAAWRRTFSAFGVSPTQYRSAPEALLRRLTKQGDIPSINTLVDIGNLVSIHYGVPVAVMDSRDIVGGITVRYADGTEHYTELGSDEIKHPDKGEVIFADENALVFARRWCWRQSFQSAARLDTTEAIIVVEAQHEGANSDIEKATREMVELFQIYAGGEYTWDVLTKGKPGFEG
jgi:DNA/RNA-binding domain of Phe-tRNA-synthetase-like protein